MKTALVKLLIAFVLGYAGVKLIELSGNSTSSDDVQKYEGLCHHTMETVGYYDTVYTQLKIVGAKINTFNFKYAVDGQFYTGANTLPGADSLPPEPTVQLWYDSEHPASYSTTDPCQELATMKTKHRLPSGWLFGGGVLLILLAIGYARSALFGLMRGAIQSARGPKKP